MVGKSFRKILIRRVDNLGDIILALPVIKNVIKAFPNAEIFVMAKEEHFPIFYKYTENLLKPISLKGLNNKVDEYDLIINIEYSFPKGYKPGRIRKNSVIHIGTPDWNKKQHIIKHIIDGLDAHKIKTQYYKPKVYLKRCDVSSAKSWMENNKYSSSDLKIMLNPSSNYSAKILPTRKFVDVCKWLVEEYNSKITIISKDYSYEVNYLLKFLEKKVKVVINQPINFISALIKQHDILIGNDSGTSHLADSLGIPTVSVFGLTSPGLWKPAGPKAVLVKNKKFNCYCGYIKERECDIDCLKSLSSEDVIDGILLSINKYIDRKSKPALNNIKLNDNYTYTKVGQGIIMKSILTQHSFLINKGYSQIKRVLDLIRKNNLYSKLIENYNIEKELLDFLFLHRVIVSKRVIE